MTRGVFLTDTTHCPTVMSKSVCPTTALTLDRGRSRWVLVFQMTVPISHRQRCIMRTLHQILPLSYLSLNREGRWGTTDDFATSFLHFPMFSIVLWDLANSRPVHSLMLSSHLLLCLPCLLLPFTVPCKMVLARPDERETCPYQHG